MFNIFDFFNVTGIGNSAGGLKLGEELLTDTGFDGGGDWVTQAGWSIADSLAKCDGSQAGNSGIYEDVPVLEAGANYLCKVEVKSYTAGNLKIVLGGSTVSAGIFTEGEYEFILESGTTNTTVNFRGNLDYIGNIDNVSCRKILE